MSCCCDPNALRVYKLNIGGDWVGLWGVEQAFLEVFSLGIADRDVLAEELLRRLKKNNYIPDSATGEYKAALLREYKEFAARAQKEDKKDLGNQK